MAAFAQQISWPNLAGEGRDDTRGPLLVTRGPFLGTRGPLLGNRGPLLGTRGPLLGSGGHGGHDGGAEGHHLQVLVGPLEQAVLGDGQLGRHLGLLSVGDGRGGNKALVQMYHQLGSRKSCIKDINIHNYCGYRYRLYVNKSRHQSWALAIFFPGSLMAKSLFLDYGSLSLNR